MVALLRPKCAIINCDRVIFGDSSHLGGLPPAPKYPEHKLSGMTDEKENVHEPDG
jgi:hypothetical protein